MKTGKANNIEPRLGFSDQYTYSKHERTVLFYQSDPVEACRDIIKRDPLWFQRLTLRDLWNKPYCLLKWGRGASKCNRGKDLQFLADTGEYVPIEQLCGKNIKVLAMDENYKLVSADARVEDNGMAECFEVKTKSGRSINVTSEHPFYTINGWIPVNDLRKGNRIAVARSMPHVTKSCVGRSRARLLGYLIGDGGITYNISFTNENQNILNDFKQCVPKAFSYHKCNLIKTINKAELLSVISVGRQKNNVKKWLMKLDIFGKNSHHKNVPNCVYTWSLADISNFIGAYFDCDGTVNTDNNSVSITSVSEELLKGIQRLLLKFGIISSIKKRNTSWVHKNIKKKSHAYVLHVYGQDNVAKFVGKIFTVSDKLSRLNMTKIKTNPNTDTIPKEIWQKYIDEYGIKLRSRSYSRQYRKKYAPSREKLSNFGSEFEIEDATKLANSDIYWDEVESITSIGLHQTYSTEVPGYHNFVADTIITHNTSTVAMYVILKAMLYPGTRIGIIAPSYRQTSYVFDEIEDMYHVSPYIRASAKDSPKRGSDRSIIKFHNGSFIEGLPIGTDGKKIRGRRYTNLFLDEYAQMDEETIRLVIRPMLAVMKKGRRNQLIVASSPYFKFNHFWDRYCYYREAIKDEPDDYHCSSYNLVDVVLAKHKEFQIDLKMVKEAYDSDPEDSFLMEWMGIFPDETTGFFTSQLIESCVPRGIRQIIPIETHGDKNAEYVMGVDPARSEKGDLFAISILKIAKGGGKHLVKMFSTRGMTFPDMADQIRKEIFLNKFNVVDLRMDSRGGGRELQDLLAKPWVHGGEVYPALITRDDLMSGKVDQKHARAVLHMVDFHIGTINEMYFKYKSDMEQQNILFPIDLRRDSNPEIQAIGQNIAGFKNEMRVMQTSTTAHGLKFDVPKKFTKDRLTATIIANYGASEYTDGEFGDEQILDNLLTMGRWMVVKGG